MNHLTFKRFIAFMMACMMAIMCCGQAVAEVYVRKASKVYASPKTSAKLLGTLKAGVEVDVTAQKNGWAQVRKGGYIGYMKSSALIEVEKCNVTAYTGSAAVMYKSFSESSGKLGKIAAGEAVRVSAKAAGWALVSYSGKTGYVKVSHLTTQAPEKQETVSYTVYAQKEGAKVYNISGKKIGTVGLNTALECTGINGNICRVVKDGKTAYMNKADLATVKAQIPVEPETVVKPETEKPEAESTSYTVYAAKDNAKVYTISGKKIGTVSLNTKMLCTGINGNICRVVKDGKTAYMNKSDLSSVEIEVKVENAVSLTAYVSNNGAKVYNTSGKVIGTLEINTQVTVTAIRNDLCRVEKDGKTAYMKKADLSSEKTQVPDYVEVAAVKVYVQNDGAKVYDASGNVIAVLKINDEVTVTAYNDTLCRVQNGSVTGFMKKTDVSAEKVETGIVEIKATKGYVRNEGAKVYDADGKVIATLKVNDEVIVTAYNDDLCQVTNGSAVGYMKKTDVSDEKVANDNSSYCLKYGDSGEAVKRLQTRLKDLGYFAGEIGGNYKTLTQSAVEAFQAAAKLAVNGIADYNTLAVLFAENAPKYDPADAPAMPAATPAKGSAKEMDWWTSGIQSIFARGTTAVVTDVATGLAWREKRTGGTNHADVQPLTAADTAVLKKVYGGAWSWNRRAVFVTINGVNYAASMNGMPHGSGSITNNNFDGHHCIHFTNSRTHGSNKLCSLHQAAIKKALSASL